jgi:hypothetical protein
LWLHRYVIRKVERNVVAVTDSDPVSQLQKVAFLIKGSDRMYLASNESEITVFQAKVGPDGADSLPDNCIWAISSAEIQKHSVCTKWAVPTLSYIFEGIIEQPIVSSIKYSPAIVEINGSGFHEHLAVWFDGVRADTSCQSSEVMICTPPPVSSFFESDGKPKAWPLSVGVFLVRADGTIYPTKYAYTFPTEGDRSGGPQRMVSLPSSSRSAGSTSKAAAAAAATAVEHHW